MRVVFFSKGGPDVPSSRYRCFRVAEELARQGVETRICDPPPRRFGLRIPRGGLAELRRLHRELSRVRRGDVLYLQRPTQNTLFVWLAVLHKTLRRLTMVFDFCDPLFVHAPFKTRLLTRAADLVVVSCEDLARWARRRNDRVVVVPNSLLAGELATRPTGSGEPLPVVGWVGAAALHADNLEVLLPAFEAVAGEAPFRFRMVGTRGAEDLVARFRAIDGLEVDAVEWLAPDRVAEVIASFDLAVLPLRDIPWNRKLVTKLVEYLGAGVPVVASPVGDNRFVLTHGVDGLLAADTGQWVHALRDLLADPQRRASIGAAGLATAARRFLLPANAERLAGLLSAARGGRP